MARYGLDAHSYSKWISNDIVIDELTKRFFEFYVLGTPSFGISQKGRDLYSYYHYTKVEEYEALWNFLCKDINDCYCAETYEKLKDHLTNHSWLGFSEMPTDIAEAICIYVGDKYATDELYNAFFSALPSTDVKGKKNEERKKEADTRKRIAYANKLFRHIRNSFAHGRFALFENEEDTYYLLQDSNQNDEVSARIIVSATRLIQWIDTLTARHESVTQRISIEEAV